jgi:rRNA maturation endonuclease Nob1
MINKAVRFCPSCKAIYKSDNITVCLKCGHATVERVVTKGVKSEATLGKQL